MSASEERLRVLREFKDREWQDVDSLSPIKNRMIAWMVSRGWLERHPDNFLTQARLTQRGYDILAQAGGDVQACGW
ncbi:hypothetical protein ADL19_15050 [Streptomyces purpurogeneiscleroticus]|nr:hypothetical protein ADL19_15050 [Streptomyces purpurogeneiscleroticus]